jgi:hypothetical protein
MYYQVPSYYPPTVHEKPTTAFALSIIAGLFIILGGIIPALLGSIIGSLISLIPFINGLGGLIVAVGMIGLIWGIIVFIGALMINSGDIGRVRIGSILVLIFSILSWFGASGGFVLGFLFGLIGGIMGLAWHPSTPQYNPQPQQPAYSPQQPMGYGGYAQQPQYNPQPQQPAYSPQQPMGYGGYAQQPSQRIVNRICPQCGRVIGENARFCPHCRRQLF